MPPDSRADGPCGPKARRTRGPASPGQRTAQPFGGTLNASPPLRCVPGASVSRGRSAGTPQAAAHAGHRSSQAFRGLRRSPYARGIGPRGGSAGLPPPAAMRGTSAPRGPPAGLPPHAGPRPSRAFRGPRRPPPTRGIGLPRGFRRHSAARRPRGASAPAGVPQVSRRPPPCAGHRPLAGLPQASRRTRGLGPRGRSAAHAARRPRGASVLAGPRRRSAGLPQAAATPGGIGPPRAFPTPPAAPAPALTPPPAARFSRKPPCGIGSRMVYCT